jgi:hypothetical protein
MFAIFALAFAGGAGSFAAFTFEVIQNRVTRQTTWSQLNADQWVMVIGSALLPVGLIGMLFTR